MLILNLFVVVVVVVARGLVNDVGGIGDGASFLFGGSLFYVTGDQ